jgi:hypothetical protein
MKKGSMITTMNLKWPQKRPQPQLKHLLGKNLQGDLKNFAGDENSVVKIMG